MTTKKLDTWVWVLIYGGLLSMSLGWFVTPQRGPWGELLISGGVVAAVVGGVLVYVRSRMKS